MAKTLNAEIDTLAMRYAVITEEIQELVSQRTQLVEKLEKKLDKIRKYSSDHISATKFSVERVKVKGYTRRAYSSVRVVRKQEKQASNRTLRLAA